MKIGRTTHQNRSKTINIDAFQAQILNEIFVLSHGARAAAKSFTPWSSNCCEASTSKDATSYLPSIPHGDMAR